VISAAQEAEEAAAADAALGLSPEEKKKMQLEQDPGFMRYIKMKKMGIPLINVRRKIKAEGAGYDWKDMNLFANKIEIE